MSKKTTYIAVEDMALDLGVIDRDLEHWIDSKTIETFLDHRNRIAVDSRVKNEFANSDEYVDCLKK